MLINSRTKTQYHEQILPNDINNSSFQDSRIQSNSSKRFTRKKDNPNDHSRLLKNNRNNDSGSFRGMDKTSNSKIDFVTPPIGYKTQDLFLRLTHTPIKERMYIPQISSDRSTETTAPRQRCETYIEDNCIQSSSRKIKIQQKQSQLDLKMNEIMTLEDENMKLKREINKKQEQFLKQNIKKQKQFQTVINQLQLQLHTLKEELGTKNQQIRLKNQQLKGFKKIQQQLMRQVKAAKFDKLLLEKQMEEIYKKKLPKQTRDLMSFRQMSLMRQLQETKERLQGSKSQQQQKMQAQIQKLKQEVIQKDHKSKHLEIHGRILNRKVIEYERELKQKSQSFGRCYTNLRESHSELLQQLKKVRKQNIKMRRLNILQHQSPNRPQNISSETDSLSFSFQSNQLNW